VRHPWYASLTAASIITLVGQSANGRQVRVGDRQKNDVISIICIISVEISI